MSSKVFSIFNYSDYKFLLRDWLDLKSRDIKGVRTKLSQICSMSPTYLSQVLNGKAHLTEEQALPLARFFTWSDLETLYFQTLLRMDKAGTKELKNFHEKERKRLLMESKDLKRRLKGTDGNTEEIASIYYSHWYFLAVHIALYIPEFRKNIDLLQKRLGLNYETMNGVIRFLLSSGLIKETKHGGYEPIETNFHLPANSPHIMKHHLNWRLQGLNSFDHRSLNDIHYSSVVSIAKADIEKLNQMLLAAIEQTRDLIGKSTPEEALCAYCIDFFELA